uniref:Peptidase S1 domain-containing protein n=1 Tax=Romanomermis culicivorax TaxID=13658 RepID=A0A915HSJ6_ROMCU
MKLAPGLYSRLKKFSDVQHVPDCLLLCMHYKDCSSSSIVKVAPKRYYCVLHSSISRQKYQVTEFMFENSIYTILHCFSKYRITKLAQKIDPGKPGDHCGEPFFAANRPSNIVRSNRILNGVDFAPFSQPWMGVVTEDERQVCGASLISKRNTDTYTNWAVSAAHCFLDDERMVLPRSKFGFVFGLHDIRVLAPYTIYRRPARIILHSQVTYLRNDIALIYFTEKIRFNHYVRPICLPGWSGQDVDVTKCSSCGWGATSESTLDDSPELRCVIDSLSSEIPSGDTNSGIDPVSNLDSTTSLRLGFFLWPRCDMGFSYCGNAFRFILINKSKN